MSEQTDETPFRYTAAMARDIESRLAGPVGGGGHVQRAQPRRAVGRSRGGRGARREARRARHVPLPFRRGPARRPPARLHRDRRLLPLPPDARENVLHALGYDAFGLPAEQYAVQTGQHPRKTTEENMTIMRRQLRRLGLGFDNRRSFATIDEEYYRWTQWIFLQIWDAWYDADARARDGGRGRARPISELVAEFESGRRAALDRRRPRLGRAVARPSGRRCWRPTASPTQSEAPVNWCPGLGTVLSNEEVTNEGRSERGNYPVFSRNLSQWKMRITAYADRLADDLDRVDWPENVKLMQRNWIGRSQGARVTFPVVTGDRRAGRHRRLHDPPRHDLRRHLHGHRARAPARRRPCPAGRLARGHQGRWKGRTPRRRATPKEAVTAYQLAASRKGDVERQTEGKDKTGVFTGSWATNPLTGERIPVFVADYVLMGYGTGAIMAVPGQDNRDWEFAEKFEIPIVRTVQATEGHPDDEPFLGDGVAINSANDRVSLDGLHVDDAKARIIAPSRTTGSARAPSTTASATGSSAGSATGASRSRSCSTTTEWRMPSRTTSCR